MGRLLLLVWRGIDESVGFEEVDGERWKRELGGEEEGEEGVGELHTADPT